MRRVKEVCSVRCGNIEDQRSAAWLSSLFSSLFSAVNSDIEQGEARPAKHLTKVIFPLGPTLSGLLKTTRRCLPQNVACLSVTPASPRLASPRRVASIADQAQHLPRLGKVPRFVSPSFSSLVSVVVVVVAGGQLIDRFQMVDRT